MDAIGKVFDAIWNFLLIRLIRPSKTWLDQHPTAKQWLEVFRLGLFQFGMGASLAPLVGTLNRVLIYETGIPAVVVAFLIAIHYFVSPVRVMIGFRSDQSRALGRWRTPYLLLGAILTYGGLAAAPFSLLILGGGQLPFVIGFIICTIIFLAYGLGANMVETIYLALVSDITPPKERGKVLAVLWVMLVMGTVVSAIVMGQLLEDYSETRLAQVMQGSAVVFLVLTVLALWGKEKLNPDGTVVAYTQETRIRTSLWESIKLLARQMELRNLFIILFIATTAFATHDVLLEPYGGQVLRMSVASTTQLTALWGLSMLLTISISGWLLWKGHSPLTLIKAGCAIGALGFLTVSVAGGPEHVNMFRGGVAFIGMGRGMFIVASIALVMSMTTMGHAGLFIGLWGVMQGLAQGFGTIGGGFVRDIALDVTGNVAIGYVTVFSSSLTFLIVSIVLIIALRLERHLDAENMRSPWAGLQDVPADQIAF
jgi:BCD family chlorophyll transporter-like MFS transporter